RRTTPATTPAVTTRATTRGVTTPATTPAVTTRGTTPVADAHESELVEGDRITDDLTALKPLGGGDSFEAWLAFDEITFGAVVVKVLRRGDESGRRVLQREVD